MTILIAWIGVDNRGPSSLYLASDSRISWGAGSNWNFGRKLFGCDESADIFGYTGAVVFPSIVLGQLTDGADRGLLEIFSNLDSAARHKSFCDFVKRTSEGRVNVPEQSFTILHGARDGSGMDLEFRIWELSYDAALRTWADEEITISPKVSGVLKVHGSGKPSFLKHYERVRRGAQGRTSRAVMWALCDTLDATTDETIGGAPQLVGLYRQGSHQSFAIEYHGQNHFLGLPISSVPSGSSVESRDGLFQRVSLNDHKAHAQRHARDR